MPLSKEQLTERAQLVAVFESSCSIEYPEPDQIEFRLGLMRRLGNYFTLRQPGRVPPPPFTKEELRERSQLVRLYKASTRIDYPTRMEARFRASVTAKLRAGFAMAPPAVVRDGTKDARPKCPHN